jgi:YjbE family integral membrane protein
MLQAGMDILAHAQFLTSLAQIVLINLLLSGDNAVIIAMACRDLPRPQRLWGMAIGAGVGVVLRLVFTVAIAWLFQLPHLKLVGGFALLYIGARLLVDEDPENKEMETAAHLWRAVWIVVVADIVMSFDNILAMVEVADNDLSLLAIGLAISIPLVVAGAALVTVLLERLPILIWAGAALLGWVAGKTIAGDPMILSLVARTLGGQWLERLNLAAGLAGAVLVVAAGMLWRHQRGRESM